MYSYRCEYCEGTVQPKAVEREAFKHHRGFVILEQVTIGVCDVCGTILRRRGGSGGWTSCRIAWMIAFNS